MSDGNQLVTEKTLAEKNKRLAIVLGLIALGFYLGFMLFYS